LKLRKQDEDCLELTNKTNNPIFRYGKKSVQSKKTLNYGKSIGMVEISSKCN